MKRVLLFASLFAAATVYAQDKPTAGLKTRDEAPAVQSAVTSTENNSAVDKLQLPTGTAVKMRLVEALSSDGNKAGDNFTGRVSEAVMLDGKTAIPVGATIEGTVTRAAQQIPASGLDVEAAAERGGRVRTQATAGE